MRTHFGPEIFTCPVPVCGRKYSTLKDVIDHFNQHPSSQTSALEDATEISEYVTRFLYSYNTGVPQWHAETDVHYTTEDDPLQYRKLFKCKLCDYKLFTNDMAEMRPFRRRIRLHVRKHHLQTSKTKSKYSCSRCHRSFAFQSNLEKHACRPKVSTSTSVNDEIKSEDLKCSACAVVFDSKIALHVHLDGHGKLPFLCLKCGLWFRHSWGIKGHLINCVE